MEYITQSIQDHYNKLKNTLALLVKNFDWKALHCSDEKCLHSRASVIRKIEHEVNDIEKEFNMPRTKHAELSIGAAKKRNHE